jgi:hypothetical protein
MTEFERSLELLIALGIAQLSARPNNERLQRALEVTTRYLETPTISSRDLETLRAWMTRAPALFHVAAEADRHDGEIQ